VTADREQGITGAFVAIADSLVDPTIDPVDLLSTLTHDCARLLNVEAAGLLLSDANAVLHVIAASSEATRNLELFQLQRDEGPCLECYRSGAPVVVPDLRRVVGRWPHFATAAMTAGFLSVHALPMRLRERVLGTLGLFGANAGVLDEQDLKLAQALAHVASIVLIADQAATDQVTLNEQLQAALSSRVVIEQAKGLLAQLGDLDMDQAFSMLRKYARDHNLRLSMLSQAVVAREVSATDVLQYSRAPKH
jgi:GAF domain-containing protein